MATPLNISIVLKPTGPECNIACSYCYFLSKRHLYSKGRTRMSDQTLDCFIAELFEARAGASVEFIWQGGEPTLMQLPFYRKVLKLIERYRAKDQLVSHSLQTNGLLLNDRWCIFLKEHNFLVGLSIDGPRHLHDKFRIAKSGDGTYELARRGWDRLKRYEVDANVVCTVHRANEEHGSEIYRHFRDDLKADWIQFIPIVERQPTSSDGYQSHANGRNLDVGPSYYTQSGYFASSRSVSPSGFGTFLTEVFDEWLSRDVGTIHVQSFEALLGSILGYHLLCVHSPTCGNALAMEHNGDVFTCDHYVEPGYKIGNIRSDSLRAMSRSKLALRFGNAKRDELSDDCKSCRFMRYCYGGCPKDRFAASMSGIRNQNYLCPGYKRFFSHAEKTMKGIADLVRERKPASLIMTTPGSPAG